MAKKILLGLHDSSVRKVTKFLLESNGHAVTAVDNLEEMLKLTKEQLLAENPFEAYLMDINLGDYGGLTYEPARIIYQEIKSQLEDNRAVFIPISGRTEVVDLCQKELGIKVYLKLGSELSEVLGKL
jgi:CheY-like chemotaxis protein